jgi:tetratricopeptide (TPR) repeat protein
MKTFAALILAALLLGGLEPASAQDWRLVQMERAHLVRAAEAHQAKRYEDATRSYIAAIRMNPMNPVSLYNLACCLAVLNHREPALSCLAASWNAGFRDLDHLKRDPELASLRKMPAYDALIRHLEEELVFERLTFAQIIERAVVAHRSGRYEDASRAYLAALRRDPTNDSILYNLACCQSLLKKPDLAIKVLAAAWVAGFRDLDHILRDPDFAPIRGTAAFRELMRRFALDLERSRQQQMLRMQMFARLARQHQARQAQAFRQAMWNWSQGGGGGGGGNGWSWRSSYGDAGGMSDGNGFVGFIGKDWSYCGGD